MDAFLPNGIFTDTHVILLQEIRNTMPGCMLSHFSHVQLFVTLWTVTCQPPLSTGLILQARILEWVAMPSSRDWSCVSYVSCIGKRILCLWATWEAQETEWIPYTFLRYVNDY